MGKVDGLAALTSAGTMELQTKLNSLEKENKTLKKVTDDLKNLVIKLEARVVSLEKGGVKAAPAAAPAAADDDDDDEVDLFGESDEEESEEKKRITEERLKAYHEKKSKKPALIAKTSVLLDIKPWDDETDMDKMLECAKSIEKEGLVWGAHKLVPAGYGIRSSNLCAWLRMKRCLLTSSKNRLQSSRITCSLVTLLPCPRSKTQNHHHTIRYTLAK